MGRGLLRLLAGILLVPTVICAGLLLRIVAFAAPDEPMGADAIVVMGAAQYNGEPSPVFQARLDLAWQLYEAGVAPTVVTVGGGQPDDDVTEAAAGRAALIAAGVPAEAITAVAEGRDSLVSLRAIAAELERQAVRSVVIVSDRWHVARCRLIARDLGLTVQVAPVLDGPAADPGIAPRYIGRELLATVFYRLTGASSGRGTAVL